MNKTRIAVAMLALSAFGFVNLTSTEEYRGTAYMPTRNDKPTLGFGTTEGVKLGQTITVTGALERALVDVQKFEGALKTCVIVPLHQHEYDALVNFAYNIGSSAFCNSTLVKKLNAGDYAGACAEISRWNKQGKAVLAGLTNRRRHERAICEGKA